MSLSIGGFSTMNYALSSTPSFSDAYTSTIKKNQPVTQYGNVDAVTPVVYPNAQEINGGRTVEQMQKAKSAAKAYRKASEYLLLLRTHQHLIYTLGLTVIKEIIQK